eukprot:tig00020531_g10004.t1
MPFTRGQHLALLAAGARTASASSSPSATGGDGAAVTPDPFFCHFSLPSATSAARCRMTFCGLHHFTSEPVC